VKQKFRKCQPLFRQPPAMLQWSGQDDETEDVRKTKASRQNLGNQALLFFLSSTPHVCPGHPLNSSNDERNLRYARPDNLFRINAMN
jgi:hypothetical protein